MTFSQPQIDLLLKHQKGRLVFIQSCQSCCVLQCKNGPGQFSDIEVLECHIKYIIFSVTCKQCQSTAHLFIFLMRQSFVCRKIYPGCCIRLFLTRLIKDAIEVFLLIPDPFIFIESSFILLISCDIIYHCIVCKLGDSSIKQRSQKIGDVLTNNTFTAC